MWCIKAVNRTCLSRAAISRTRSRSRDTRCPETTPMHPLMQISHPHMHRFSDLAGSASDSRITPPAMLPSACHDDVGTPIHPISRLNSWPVRTPVQRFAAPSRVANAWLGATVGRYSFGVGLFHPHLHAGLSRRFPSGSSRSSQSPRTAALQRREPPRMQHRLQKRAHRRTCTPGARTTTPHRGTREAAPRSSIELLRHNEMNCTTQQFLIHSSTQNNCSTRQNNCSKNGDHPLKEW